DDRRRPEGRQGGHPARESRSPRRKPGTVQEGQALAAQTLPLAPRPWPPASFAVSCRPAPWEVTMLQPWRNSSALVTGGGSGIGRALALALAARGARVMVSDLDPAAAAAVAALCGPSASSHGLDVRDAAAFQALVDEAVARHGRLDYLFNN